MNDERSSGITQRSSRDHQCCALIGKVTNLDILSFLSCSDKHKIHTQLTVCSLCMFSSGVSSFFVLALQGGP